MRTIGLLVLAGSMLGLSTLRAAPLCTAGAGIWNEGDAGEGDAGKLPGSANITVGVGSLTKICGSLDNSGSGGDMYEIMITNSTFTALTAGIGVNGIDDPALYLFDSTGHGLYANNDISAASTQAGFTLTGLTPGLYFLAIVPDNQQPEHGTNLIFGDITGTNTTVFTPVISNTRVDGWTNSGDSSGDYSITLRNAAFATTPEPATFGLIGLGLGLLAFARRRAN
jgi:PEP-CTERM motif-containing protein